MQGLPSRTPGMNWPGIEHTLRLLWMTCIKRHARHDMAPVTTTHRILGCFVRTKHDVILCANAVKNPEIFDKTKSKILICTLVTETFTAEESSH